MMCGYWYSGWAWIGMPVMLLLMIALLVIFGWALVRWLNRKTTLPTPHDAYPIHEPPALEVLERRYARGEIDTAMFENMRERLVASVDRDDYLYEL